MKGFMVKKTALAWPGLARLAEPRAHGRSSEGQAAASTQRCMSLCKKGDEIQGKHTDIWYIETLQHPF